MVRNLQLAARTHWLVGTENSGLPGGPLHSHPTRLLLHHQCPFSNSTLERGRDLIWLLEGLTNPGAKDPPYLHNWCFMRGNCLVFNLRVMCFKYPGPYKDQVMSYWWAIWGGIGSSWGTSAAEHRMDKGTETRETVGLRRACSCATAAAKAPGSMTPCTVLWDPRLRSCPFYGQVRHPQMRKLEKVETSCLFLFLCVVLFYFYT